MGVGGYNACKDTRIGGTGYRKILEHPPTGYRKTKEDRGITVDKISYVSTFSNSGYSG